MNIKGLDNPVINEDINRILMEDLSWDTLAGSTILVAGANGMIPSYVVYTLLGLNDMSGADIKVLALVRNEAKARRVFGNVLERGDLELLVQDVTEPLKMDGPVDYIFHGASAARPSQHKTAPTATIRANLTGTFNLLDLAVEKGSKGFVLMSSSEVYGKVSGVDKISEKDYGWLDSLDPRSCYSEGKRAAETICASYSSQYGIRCCIPRFAHIYGPGLSLDDGRVQADFAANVFRGENIVMKSDGNSQRAYTYVSDAVAGMFYVLIKGDEGCTAYNIADSQNIITIRRLAEAFIASRPEKELSLIIDIPEGTAGMYNPAAFIGLDDSRIRSLGWAPHVDIDEGTRRMISYYEEQERIRK